MNSIDSFSSKSLFYADSHFPYGLRRSGEFTRHQSDLLEQHGNAYEALHNGSRQPETEEEIAFIAVCNGLKEATTDHEKAWSKFCQVTNKKKSYITAFGGVMPKSGPEDIGPEVTTDLDVE